MLQTVLLITAVGMGLVFVAILLLWTLMEALVRMTKDRATAIPPEQDGADPIAGTPEGPRTRPAAEKRRAAAAAVAAALRLRRRQVAIAAVRIALAERPDMPAAGRQAAELARSSNWQPVMRAAQMESRLRLFSRKSRRSSS